MDRFYEPHRRRRPWFARFLMLVFSVGLIFLLWEVAMRLLWSREAVLFPAFHTDATYGEYRLRRLRPSTTFLHTSADGRWKFTTNAQGFRDYRNYQYKKAPGVRRILCLGDSHTEGYEARQDRIYPVIIERRLQQMGHDAEVLNTAIAGFGTAEQLLFFENEGVKYAPEVVVLGFTVHDLYDNVKSDLFRLDKGQLVPQRTEYLPGINTLNVVNNLPPTRWLSQHSYAYSLLFNRLWTFQTDLFSSNPVDNVDLKGRPSRGAGQLERLQPQLTAQLVTRLHRVCAERRIRLLIIDLPWMPNPGDVASSIPQEIQPAFVKASDAMVSSEQVLWPYKNVAEIYRPNGEHHISETSHLLLGMAAAEKIAAWLGSTL